jgi:Spy/CpxP family protein refolding chaperone
MMIPSRNPLLLLTAALLLGGGIGLITGMQVARQDRGHSHGRGPRGHVERLQRELDLTPDQRDSVRAILERHRPGFDSVWAESRPRYETLRDRVRSDIRAQLDPHQQRRYDDMIARLDAERRAREDNNAPR